MAAQPSSPDKTAQQEADERQVARQGLGKDGRANTNDPFESFSAFLNAATNGRFNEIVKVVVEKLDATRKALFADDAKEQGGVKADTQTTPNTAQAVPETAKVAPDTRSAAPVVAAQSTTTRTEDLKAMLDGFEKPLSMNDHPQGVANDQEPQGARVASGASQSQSASAGMRA